MAHRGVASRIVGYGPAIEQLHDTANRAEHGHGGAVVIDGEAGAGKTTVVDEFTRGASGAIHVSWGRCRPDGDAPAFWPWAQLLDDILGTDREYARRVAADDAAAVPALAPALAARLGFGQPATPIEGRRLELFDAIARIVERAAETRTLVLVVDDLQWADVVSTKLVAHVIPRLSRRRVLLVATLRTGEPLSDAMRAACSDVRRDAPTISLTGLDAKDIAELLDEAGVAPEPGLVDTLVARTGGNPFFVTRLVAGLTAAAAAGAVAEPGRLRVLAGEVPNEVAEVVGRRAARLPSAVADLLSAAAVIGAEGSLETLAAVAETSLDEAFERVAAAVGLLDERDDRFSFSHALVRDAVYSNLAPAIRRRLHLRALDALAGDPGAVNARARHALAALPLGDRLAAVALNTAAAAAAVERLAYEEAADRYASARSAGAAELGPRERASLLVREGEARRLAGETGVTAAVFLEAADLLTDEDDELLARAALGYADPGADLGLAYQASDPTTRALLERAIDAQRTSETPMAARLRARCAAELYFSSQPDRSRPLAEEAVAIARRVGDPRTLAVALAGHHDAFVVGAIPASDALAEATEILQHARASGDPLAMLVAHRARVFDLVAMGDFDAVAAEIAAFTRIADAQRVPAYRWWPTLWEAMHAQLQGRHADAERIALDAFAIGEQLFGGLALTNLSFTLFFLARERGRLADLEDATRAFAAAQADIPAIRAALAMLLAEIGKLDEARGIVSALGRDGYARLRDRNWPASWFQLARATYLTGDVETACALLELGRPLRGECVMVSLATVCLGAAELGLAWLSEIAGDLDAADAAYRGAAATNARVGARSWLAQTRVDHAALLQRRGRVDEAMPLARLALDAATDIGLLPVDIRARSLLAGAPARPGPAVEVARFHRDGAVWDLHFAGRSVRVAHTKGLADLAWLLARPGEPVAAVELLARQNPGAPVDSGRGDPMLDDRARTELRDHLRELDAELDDARAAHDLERAAQLAAARDTVLEAAAAAFGLTGRSRRLGDSGERARKAVGARIRNAVDRIRAPLPELGAHLERSIDTGTWCVYRPERPITWEM